MIEFVDINYKLNDQMKPCLLFLSCKNIEEADKISYELLSKKLIVCAKKIPINSSYLWKNKIKSSREILLIMDSIEENFEKINQKVKKLHSYETYALSMTDVKKTNDEVLRWIANNIQ